MTKIVCFILLTFFFVAALATEEGVIRKDDQTDRLLRRQVDGQNMMNTTGSMNASPRYSIENMTCDFFEQPLNHFVPRGTSPSYRERYCLYDGFAHEKEGLSANSPIFFYTGNESPLEQYINQTGLMWELAPKFRARVVFVEHRYEGQSLPRNISKDCMSYASTIQALADYARILEVLLNPGNTSPVIVFGGSYGGMLSAWMRMKYPHLVAGAIAASAPIGAFPQDANEKIDSSARVLSAGLKMPYPPTSGTTEVEHYDLKKASDTTSTMTRNLDSPGSEQQNHCHNNLLAAWPLIAWMAKDEDNSLFLQRVFSLCNPVLDKTATPLLEWAQGIWFDLAEGSFPYPSSYIPFALLHEKVDLPAWPMQAACWKVSQLHKDWGVRFSGDLGDVQYKISYGDSNVTLSIDWEHVTEAGKKPSLAEVQKSPEIIGLLTSVRDAVSIWYNVTKNIECYNVSEVAPNMKRNPRRGTLGTSISRNLKVKLDGRVRASPTLECYREMIRVGSWEPVCCNDEMNLVITEARGLGQDFFWPPSLPRGVNTYADMVQNVTQSPCADPRGIFGYSKEPYELWSTRLYTHFGGSRMNGHSNIVFSNGLLDPWSAGGVYPSHTQPNPDQSMSLWLYADEAMVQNVTENDVISLVIPFGGHHTDLMYQNPLDPACASEARSIEERYVAKWIHQWNSQW
jgi:pimeloyl-ACP methyl ester carboxylesterase